MHPFLCRLIGCTSLFARWSGRPHGLCVRAVKRRQDREQRHTPAVSSVSSVSVQSSMAPYTDAHMAEMVRQWDRQAADYGSL